MASVHTKKITLVVTKEQEEKIKILYRSENWDFVPEEQVVSDVVQQETEETRECLQRPDQRDQGQDDEVNPSPAIPQVMLGEECPHCLCTPCVTSDIYRQMWWPTQRQADHRNNTPRKKIYKKFWGFMANLGLWNDPRYVARKNHALTRDPHYRNYAWIRAVRKREIMPNCVLKFVRGCLPSPDGQYMGHMWE